MSRLRFATTPAGMCGVALLALVLLVALVGPFFAGHPPAETIGLPFAGPGDGAPLGTDGLGRDALARTLWGGRSVLEYAGLATLLAYVAGAAIGLVAGYVRGPVDALLMRAVDVLVSVPALLFILVLVTGAGASNATLVAAVAVVQAPLIARVVRTATLEQSVRAFVEAALARGERASAIIVREIVPNIVPSVMADAGLRLTYSIILVASVNFFGLGLQPPAADWALMISENRDGFDLNPWVIVAPAAMIALLTIAVNLIGDALARSLGQSDVRSGA
jgi:ABC-type dipeptide/oligopeptide/nickel transport system permease subunit